MLQNGQDHILTIFAGADYSAAAPRPNATWLALGKHQDNALVIYSLEKIGSDRLGQSLIEPRESDERLLAGLDFPFSWPTAFLEWLEANSKPESIAAPPGESSRERGRRLLRDFNFVQLETKAIEFGREPRRLTDELIRPKAQSPLHRINPGMLKMTWQGATLLQELAEAGFHIAPFDGLTPEAAVRAWAMEVYPAATLKVLGLSFQKYKGRAPEAIALRETIIVALAKMSKLHTVNSGATSLPDLLFSPELRGRAVQSDDALDAALACYGAYLTVILPDLILPQAILAAGSPTLPQAAEGWIYSPYSPLT